MLKKHLSQHLIKDKNLLKKMVLLSKITKEDTVVEIGAGQGDLTRYLCEYAGCVYAIEIDRSFKRHLEALLDEYKNLNLMLCDFLEINLPKLCNDISKPKIKIFGNIPYKITAPILFKLIENRSVISDAFLTVQKEFGERLTARPSNKIYGAVSVVCQLVADIKILLKLKSHIFIPPPKVDSVFLSMIFKGQCDRITDKHIKFIRNCFENKRKYMKNTLIKHYGPDKVKRLYNELNLYESIRAEELEPHKFLEIFEFLHE
ncbi:MAG: 16S rRNA (adenine(1518)-N(6)/adenine(1519)-N(6))-dimethyltransferase RsmA [Syntrophorhabdaceae bacterium]|nr:16S rRNA (adenine(1518)-N(6)/adenine(1519)-N(6))-dimethyltransferase RsmA [Syntrophorhabdaceae bacterium]